MRGVEHSLVLVGKLYKKYHWSYDYQLLLSDMIFVGTAGIDVNFSLYINGIPPDNVDLYRSLEI